MSVKILPIENEPGAYIFECPGCKSHHKVNTGPANSGGAVWGYNGNMARPTFTPSILARGGHYLDQQKPCWCDFNDERKLRGEEPSKFACFTCHSFVTDGRIQFLSDCTHDLAGQTVELPDLR